MWQSSAAGHSICLVTVDGLRARSLGPYGHHDVPTPCFNQFAANGILWEDALAFPWEFAESPGPGAVSLAECFAQSINALRDQAAATVLITDDLRLLERVAHNFTTAIGLTTERVAVPADSLAETQAAIIFAQLWDILQQTPSRSVVWLHTHHLQTVWDAPLALREMLSAEGAPPPLLDVLPPDRAVSADDDELIWQWRAVYGAQIAVLDWCWGVFQDQMSAWQAQRGPLLTLLMGTRGYPLGEHERLGGSARCPYHETLHVPVIMQPGYNRHDGVRWPGLIDVQGALELTLARVYGQAAEPEVAPGWLPKIGRDVCYGTVDGRSLIRTHGWHLVAEGNRVELYLKPDDRWDQNDVSRRCPHVVEGLLALLDSLWGKAPYGSLRLDGGLPRELYSYE